MNQNVRRGVPDDDDLEHLADHCHRFNRQCLRQDPESEFLTWDARSTRAPDSNASTVAATVILALQYTEHEEMVLPTVIPHQIFASVHVASERHKRKKRRLFSPSAEWTAWGSLWSCPLKPRHEGGRRPALSFEMEPLAAQASRKAVGGSVYDI